MTDAVKKVVQANVAVESRSTSATCQGMAVARCSVMRCACSYDACSPGTLAYVLGRRNVFLCSSSATPQHSPAAPGLCTPDLAEQRVRDLLVDMLERGHAQRCVWDGDPTGDRRGGRARPGILTLSVTGLQRPLWVCESLLLLGLSGSRVEMGYISVIEENLALWEAVCKRRICYAVCCACTPACGSAGSPGCSLRDAIRH